MLEGGISLVAVFSRVLAEEDGAELSCTQRAGDEQDVTVFSPAGLIKQDGTEEATLVAEFSRAGAGVFERDGRTPLVLPQSSIMLT